MMRAPEAGEVMKWITIWGFVSLLLQDLINLVSSFDLSLFFSVFVQFRGSWNAVSWELTFVFRLQALDDAATNRLRLTA